MTGGLIQIVAYGAQDIFLTGNPQITWFKLVYRRYTNFSTESIPQIFSGDADFGKRTTCTIARNGDLMNKMTLQCTLPKLNSSLAQPGRVRWVDKVGHALVKTYELMIGGQSIDRQYGEWLEIWNQLTLPESKQAGYNRMIGHVNSLHYDATKGPYTIFVPLQFWFCKNIGLSLPLIALQYHDVKVNVEFRSLQELIIQEIPSDVFTGSIADMSLYVDYVYLDTDERRRFAQVSHEYLIEQLQFTGDESINLTSNNIKLALNHPVKYLAFVAQKDEYVTTNVNQYFNWTDSLQIRTTAATVPTFDESSDYQDAIGSGPVVNAKLTLNGHDRFQVRPGEYFNLVQPYQCFSAVPTSPGLYVYSFALRPEDAQPSGTCNFSRIDTATVPILFKPSLFLDSNQIPVTARFRIYAVNVNVLRIVAGMAGLSFSD